MAIEVIVVGAGERGRDWIREVKSSKIVTQRDAVQRIVVIYPFAEHRYDRFETRSGSYPIWLSDNRRVLFRELAKLYVLDRLSGKWKEILALPQPSQIGNYAFSRDNKRLYYAEVLKQIFGY